MRNHGRLFNKITAAGLAPLLLVAGLPPTAAAESCKDWNTEKFFKGVIYESAEKSGFPNLSAVASWVARIGFSQVAPAL